MSYRAEQKTEERDIPGPSETSLAEPNLQSQEEFKEGGYGWSVITPPPNLISALRFSDHSFLRTVLESANMDKLLTAIGYIGSLSWLWPY